MSQGYLLGKAVPMDANSPDFVSALGKFQADAGMVVSGVVDFATYERVLRNFVALDKEGRLVQVGWSPAHASPAATLAGAAAEGCKPVPAGSPAPVTYGATPPARTIDLQIENVLVGRTAFQVGEQVFVSATLSRASYMYCFLHEAGGTVLRLLPNATNPNALLFASHAIRIPDWMSPTPGFIMDSTSASTERLGCFATDEDVTARLPELLRSPALVPLPNVRSLDSVRQAFATTLGREGHTSADVEWRVVPRRVAAVGAAPVASR